MDPHRQPAGPLHVHLGHFGEISHSNIFVGWFRAAGGLFKHCLRPMVEIHPTQRRVAWHHLFIYDGVVNGYGHYNVQSNNSLQNEHMLLLVFISYALSVTRSSAAKADFFQIYWIRIHTHKSVTPADTFIFTGLQMPCIRIMSGKSKPENWRCKLFVKCVDSVEPVLNLR